MALGARRAPATPLQIILRIELNHAAAWQCVRNHAELRDDRPRGGLARRKRTASRRVLRVVSHVVSALGHGGAMSGGGGAGEHQWRRYGRRLCHERRGGVPRALSEPPCDGSM